MVEKGTRSGICQTIHRYAKANNRYMKNYDKNITSSYLAYLDANNLYGWAMSQKRPVNGFEWVEGLFQFKEDFIKNYDENSTFLQEIFLKWMLSIEKIDLIFIVIYHFYLKERKSENVKSLFVTFIIKKLCRSHKGFKISTKS